MTSDLEERFRRLAERWLDETVVLSSTTAIVAHPAFREIVSMGEPVIPLVLREMEKGEGHWFLALRRITGANPVPPAHQGKVRLIEADWFDWARKNGYEW